MPPKIWYGEKNVQNSARLDNFRLWSRISPELLQISKIWKKFDRQRFLPRSRKKSPVNFGPQTKKFYWLELSHQSEFLGKDYISAPRGFCALKFIHALEIAQALIAHTQSGTEVPQKILIVKI